jgi:hypothetical protein
MLWRKGRRDDGWARDKKRRKGRQIEYNDGKNGRREERRRERCELERGSTKKEVRKVEFLNSSVGRGDCMVRRIGEEG